MPDDPAEAFEIDEVREGDRPCPVCGQRMRLETKRPVTVDVCPEHGIWLDRGELDTILGQMRIRQRRRHRGAVQRARRDGKVSGAFFGWWSLLFD